MPDLTPLFGAALGNVRQNVSPGGYEYQRQMEQLKSQQEAGNQEDAWMGWAAQYMPDLFNQWLELSKVSPNQNSGMYFKGQDIAKAMKEAFKDFKIKESQAKNASGGSVTKSVWEPTWVTGPDGQMYYAATAEEYNRLVQRFNQEARQAAARPGNPGSSSSYGPPTIGTPRHTPNPRWGNDPSFVGSPWIKNR